MERRAIRWMVDGEQQWWMKVCRLLAPPVVPPSPRMPAEGTGPLGPPKGTTHPLPPPSTTHRGIPKNVILHPHRGRLRPRGRKHSGRRSVFGDRGVNATDACCHNPLRHCMLLLRSVRSLGLCRITHHSLLPRLAFAPMSTAPAAKKMKSTKVCFGRTLTGCPQLADCRSSVPTRAPSTATVRPTND
jgi:hypothetical protein